MIIAELEVCHSRAIAPTRRIALGARNLPVSPSPGAGGLLLAGIVANSASQIQPELREGLCVLIQQLADGQRVVQPRVQHRFQTDRVGLLSSRHRLIGSADRLHFEFADETGRPIQHALTAVYAAASLPRESQDTVFEAIVESLMWVGEVDGRFMSKMMGGRGSRLGELMAWNDPVAWAFDLLGLDADEPINQRLIRRRFRHLLSDAHPDHGGLTQEAAERISDLSEARRILSDRDIGAGVHKMRGQEVDRWGKGANQ